MPNLFRTLYSDHKANAQDNLNDRSHYVSDGNLRYHKSRVMSFHITDGGLLCAVVTSDSANFEGTKRGFRYAIFDVFGTVIRSDDCETYWPSSDKARKAMWKALNVIDAKAHTLEAIERHRGYHTSEMDRLAGLVGTIEASKREIA